MARLPARSLAPLLVLQVQATPINLAQTIRQYNLTHSAVRAPNVSVNDLRHSWMAEQQLQNLFDCLTDSTKWTWENRRRDEYVRSCGNKTVITETGLVTINTTDVDPNVAVINDATTGSKPGGLAGSLFDITNDPKSGLHWSDYDPRWRGFWRSWHGQRQASVRPHHLARSQRRYHSP
jgi:hypothetical protein